MDQLQIQLPLFNMPSAIPAAMTWQDITEQYLAARQLSGTAPASLKAFERDLRALAAIYPRIDPRSLTIRQALKATEITASQVAQATAARRHGTWRACFRWMVQEKMITDSPFQFSFTATPRHQKPIKFLSQSQAKQFLFLGESFPAAHFLAAVTLATGCKPVELTKMLVVDLDAEQQLVTIRGRQVRVAPAPISVFNTFATFRDAYMSESELAIPYSKRWMEKKLSCLSDVAMQQEIVSWPVTFSILRWTRAVWDMRAGVKEDRLRIKLGYSRLAWKNHVLPVLLPWVPSPLEQTNA